MRSHDVHSGAVMVTRLGRLRHALTRRSSTCTRASARACLTALRTVVSDTPASAAMWPMVSVHAPLLAASSAITARTAVSASVNRAAKAGGRRPEAAHRRLLSMLAPDLGREPTRLCMGL